MTGRASNGELLLRFKPPAGATASGAAVSESAEPVALRLGRLRGTREYVAAYAADRPSGTPVACVVLLAPALCTDTGQSAASSGLPRDMIWRTSNRQKSSAATESPGSQHLPWVNTVDADTRGGMRTDGGPSALQARRPSAPAGVTSCVMKPGGCGAGAGAAGTDSAGLNAETPLCRLAGRVHRSGLGGRVGVVATSGAESSCCSSSHAAARLCSRDGSP